MPEAVAEAVNIDSRGDPPHLGVAELDVQVSLESSSGLLGCCAVHFCTVLAPSDLYVGWQSHR